jgi:two-component system chemotaxis response regulator CheY
MERVMYLVPPHISNRLQAIKVLVVDDEFYTRKVIRTLLMAIGVTHISDAASGAEGLEAIGAVVPDVVLVDWEMPNMDGAAFVRQVRTPGRFRHPNVPMIMLSGHSERWRVEEAMRLGINEYLLKPVSAKMLCDRLITTLNNPRPIVKVGRYYGPEPRAASAYKPVNEASMDEIAIIKPASQPSIDEIAIVKPVEEIAKPKPVKEASMDEIAIFTPVSQPCIDQFTIIQPADETRKPKPAKKPVLNDVIFVN